MDSKERINAMMGTSTLEMAAQRPARLRTLLASLVLLELFQQPIRGFALRTVGKEETTETFAVTMEQM